MSKRHHVTRRRAYGRRQHELHQRQDPDLLATWREGDAELPEIAIARERWAGADPSRRQLGLGYSD